jgi:hypothetical protein
MSRYLQFLPHILLRSDSTALSVCRLYSVGCNDDWWKWDYHHNMLEAFDRLWVSPCEVIQTGRSTIFKKNVYFVHLFLHIFILQNYCTIFWVVLARFCPILVQVKSLKTPFGLVTPFIPIPITRSYNHTQLLLSRYACTQLTILRHCSLLDVFTPWRLVYNWLSCLSEYIG